MASKHVRTNVQMTIGMFTFPVNAETAIEGTKEVSLNTLCQNDHGPAQTRQKLACPVCDNSDRTSFVKGKEMTAGRFVVVPEAKLEELGVGEKNSLSIQPHPAEDIRRVLPGDKVYFLTPAAPAAAETYALVVALIKSRRDVVFFTKWAVRSATSMYQLDVLEDVLVLKHIAWPGSVRALPQAPTAYNEALLDMAGQLVDAVKVPYDPEQYVDDRTKDLLAYIASAEGVAGADVVEDDNAVPSLPKMDLKDQLLASVKAAQAQRAGKTVPAQPVPAELPANVEPIGGVPKRKLRSKKAVAKSA